MRLDQIVPWGGALFPINRKTDDATRAKTPPKPPSGDAGVSGVQPEAVTNQDQRPPQDDQPGEGINIVV